LAKCDDRDDDDGLGFSDSMSVSGSVFVWID